MKKYITLAALLAAGTAFANAESLLPDLLVLGERADTRVYDKESTWVEALGAGAVTADNVATNLASSDILATTGWHWGVSNHQTAAYSDDVNGVMSSVSSDGFTITGRGAYGGSFVAATINLEDLISENEVLTSLSIEFSASSVNSLYFSLWSWDGETATSLRDVSSVSANTPVSVDVENLKLSSSDAIFALWGSDSRGADSVITGLSSSYTVSAVPEPSAFGMLAGLGALALVAARRRRK